MVRPRLLTVLWFPNPWDTQKKGRDRSRPKILDGRGRPSLRELISPEPHP